MLEDARSYYKTKDAEYRIQRLSISFTQMSDELTANI